MAKRKRTASESGGYGRPPKHSQFKPGQSGNPSGRPKGSRAIGDVLRDVLRQKIAVTENGKTRRLPVMDVVFRRLANDAIRSDTTAIKLLLTLYERYQDANDSPASLDRLLADDKEILARYMPSTSKNSSPKKATTKRIKNDGRR